MAFKLQQFPHNFSVCKNEQPVNPRNFFLFFQNNMSGMQPAPYERAGTNSWSYNNMNQSPSYPQQYLPPGKITISHYIDLCMATILLAAEFEIFYVPKGNFNFKSCLAKKAHYTVSLSFTLIFGTSIWFTVL